MSHVAPVIDLQSRRDEHPAVAQMRSSFAKMQQLSRTEAAPTAAQRRAHLDALEAAIRSRMEEITRAVDADFGTRSRHETLLADVFPTIASLQHARKHLGRWMKPRNQPVHWTFQPGTAHIVPQPLGVVGIIAPWNYPVQLALSPLVSALAAGNRVLIKPSELTPKTSQLLADLVSATFSPDVVQVVQGGTEVAEAFSKLPFDHLLFTGSTRLGYVVMKAAAENLTPVTLELGGKSPAIIGESFALDKAAERILMGKLLNAGQTCIAPDYVLLPRGKTHAFVEACRAVMQRTRPTLQNNPDYTAIVNDRQYARLQGLLAEAQGAGATLEVLNPAQETLPAAERKIAPTLVLNAPQTCGVMQDEIFGPILPVVEYGELSEAIDYVNARPRPLALYLFERDNARTQAVVQRTTSGGVTINDTLMHIAQEELPFGGVGPAGMGAYHGKMGFDTFSHCKSVFYQSRINAAGLLNPPYGKTIERMLDVLMR